MCFKKLNKKGAVGYFYENWPELLTFLFLIVGFILAATAKSAIMSYIIIFLCGALGGRLWHMKRKEPTFIFGLMLTGFFIGFVIGNFYGSLTLTTVCYLAGIVLSYHAHDKMNVKKI